MKKAETEPSPLNSPAYWNQQGAILTIPAPRPWRIMTVGWILIDSKSALLVDVNYVVNRAFSTSRPGGLRLVTTARRSARSLDSLGISTFYVSRNYRLGLALPGLVRFLEDGSGQEKSHHENDMNLIKLTYCEMGEFISAKLPALIIADRLMVVCVQCGEARRLRDMPDGVCSSLCFHRVLERESRAVEKAERNHTKREARRRVLRDPDWARTGASIHTVPGPGPTQ